MGIHHPLRPGGICRSFTANYGRRDLVAELYSDPNRAQEDASKIENVNQIVKASAAVAGNEPWAEISMVVAVEGQRLLLAPIGTNFTATIFKLHHLKMLLRTLKIVHQANVIHRDVRFSNIFLLTEKDEVFLNDWGASTQSGSVQLVQGCPEPFCHPELVPYWLSKSSRQQSMTCILWCHPLLICSCLDYPMKDTTAYEKMLLLLPNGLTMMGFGRGLKKLGSFEQ